MLLSLWHAHFETTAPPSVIYPTYYNAGGDDEDDDKNTPEPAITEPEAPVKKHLVFKPLQFIPQIDLSAAEALLLSSQRGRYKNIDTDDLLLRIQLRKQLMQQRTEEEIEILSLCIY